MRQNGYDQILELALDAAMQDSTADYLTEHLKSIVEHGEAVLICLPTQEPGGLGDLMARAVTACGGIPVSWGADHRWKSLLRLAFTSRATAIIGTPLVVLGLSKLKKAAQTPLYIKNVVLAGYSGTDWMWDGIRRGFDCRMWAVMGVFVSPVVAGFSCGHGVHIREEAYILDAPEGRVGRWILSPREYPELRVQPGEFGRLTREPCPCGRPGARMLDRRHWNENDRELAELAESLLSWTSVLDCSLKRSTFGLELELVVFPGEKLPQLPSCARLVVRPWNPEADQPLPEVPTGKNLAEHSLLH